jgi:nifR3 family TIM-barrel protein
MQIGPLKLETPLLLAPIAGHCDLAFRILCREQGGVGIAYTDLLNSRAILAGRSKSLKLAATNALDQPLGMQLYGNSEDPLPEAALWAIDRGASVIDINMGCPVDKVAKKNGGSLLLRDCGATLKLVERIIGAVDRHSGGRIPVTAKIRLGWDDENLVGPMLARDLEAAGIAALTVHGRTTVQLFSGSADWSAIGEVVAAVRSIPVFGNGDVTEPEHVQELMRTSGCQGVMIGRGALRTPWIFRRARTFLETGAIGPEPSFNDKCRTILRHIDLLDRYTEEQYGLRTMRQKISRYGKTMGHVKSMKEAVRTAGSYDQMRSAVRSWILPHREDVTALVQREYDLQVAV